MAFDWSVVYTNANIPDANYPNGSAKNVSSPAATDGTPGEKTWVNDMAGFHQRLILEAGITVSGAADTVLASDKYDALITLFSMKYDTVADMKAANLQVGTFVTTKGYLSAGDGGGANYMIVAPATGTDDGGQFIDLTTSPNNQAQLIPGVSVTSKQYGAVGNGVADDTTQIQNLIDAFDNIVINTFSLVTGLTLRSDIKIEILETLKILNGNLITATNKGQIAIIFRKNGLLLGDNSTSDIGILLDGCTDINIYNPLMTFFVGTGISIINGSTSCRVIDGLIQQCTNGIDIEDNTTLYNEVARVRVNSCDFGLRILGASSNNIESISCIGSINAGIFLQDKTGGCVGNTFKACKCNDGTGVTSTDGGVVIEPAVILPSGLLENIFMGQICDNNGGYGIVVVPFSGGTRSINSTKFIAPVCTNNGLGGIYLSFAKYVDITDAICNSNTSHGLDTDDCNGVRVSGGEFSDNSIDGIHHQSIRTITDGATLIGNGRYGLSVSDGVVAATEHLIINCFTELNTTEPVSFTGSASAVTKAVDCKSTDFVTNNRGVISVNNSAAIAHGLILPTGYTPSNIIIIATASVSGNIVTITSKNATTFIIGLINHNGTSVAVNEDINWEAYAY